MMKNEDSSRKDVANIIISVYRPAVFSTENRLRENCTALLMLATVRTQSSNSPWFSKTEVKFLSKPTVKLSAPRRTEWNN